MTTKKGMRCGRRAAAHPSFSAMCSSFHFYCPRSFLQQSFLKYLNLHCTRTQLHLLHKLHDVEMKRGCCAAHLGIIYLDHASDGCTAGGGAGMGPRTDLHAHRTARSPAALRHSDGSFFSSFCCLGQIAYCRLPFVARFVTRRLTTPPLCFTTGEKYQHLDTAL
jgi:hypothetical protein